jgi:hypothetical protein
VVRGEVSRSYSAKLIAKLKLRQAAEKLESLYYQYYTQTGPLKQTIARNRRKTR